MTSYCNGEVDCEDATDEINCTCGNRLETYNRSLVCDGVIHCNDWTDELDCPGKGEFSNNFSKILKIF